MSNELCTTNEAIEREVVAMLTERMTAAQKMPPVLPVNGEPSGLQMQLFLSGAPVEGFASQHLALTTSHLYALCGELLARAKRAEGGVPRPADFFIKPPCPGD